MNRSLFGALVVVTGLALAWGFSIVGGPGFARMEAHDQQRARDLQRLGQYHACDDYTPNQEDRAARPYHCVGARGLRPDVTDPLTDAPYALKFEGQNTFSICATFEVPQEQRHDRFEMISFEGQQGCVRYRRDGPGQRWQQVS